MVGSSNSSFEIQDEQENNNLSGNKPLLNLSTKEGVEEKFNKKMDQVAKKELETESMRLAANLGVPHIDLTKFPVSQQALKQVDRQRAEELQAVCFYATPEEVRLGAIVPNQPEVLELMRELEEKNNSHGAIYTISYNSLERVLNLYNNLPVIKAITKDVNIKADDLEKVQADVNDFTSLQSLIDKKSTSDLVTYLLGAALKLNASDLHVEAEEKRIIVRFRLDGILHDAVTLPKESYKKLVSRIKLISSIKINISDKPQDGRFSIKTKDGDIDIRVSTMPTIYGESIVMRVLKQNRKGLSLDELGFFGDAFEKIKTEIQRPNGMIITTGPTGSGKTTTMYAIMQILNEPGVKIITLEDPVEYKMPGINQSQIDKSKDYTFAKGLKSILRQDPDIAMVGEIRDLETADIAIQAALTGHLILSTIHTNSASGAIPRFLSMGVKPFLLAPSLNCVIGQRLVRKICTKCKQQIKLDSTYEERVKKVIETMPKKEKEEITKQSLVFYQGKGCSECNNIGYKGRIGIYEIFIMDPKIEQLVLSGKVSEFEIEKIATENGMVTMVQDGIIKALKGITSVDEVFRVIE